MGQEEELVGALEVEARVGIIEKCRCPLKVAIL